MVFTRRQGFVFVFLATCVSGGWWDPTGDVILNPECRPEAVIPTIAVPRDVTELHPAHIKYAMAIGDSVTAASCAKGYPFEHRHLSFSGGSGSSSDVTMPWLVQQYSGRVTGGSIGNFQWDQFGPCCGMWPWWSGVEGNNNQLNAALAGGVSKDWKVFLQHLTELVTGVGFGNPLFGGFPKWSYEQQMDYKNNWKVLTITLGTNDVASTMDACTDDEEVREAIVVRYRIWMTEMFEFLVADPDGVFGKLYVNLVGLLGMSNLGLENDAQKWCSASGQTYLKEAFPCMHYGGDLVEKGRLVDDTYRQVNEVMEELAAKYDRKRPDFGVNVFKGTANQQIMNADMRSQIDCFHPTAKAHRVMGVGLWNSMLRPSHSAPFSEWNNTALCATPDTKLVTYTQQNRGTVWPFML